MQYARKLRKGDKVAIVSLSSGMLGEDFCSHNIEIGVKRLKDVFHFRAEVPVILADKSSHNFQVESLKEVGIPI